MLRSMSTAVSGLENFQSMLDVTANNIANVDTYGFKASRMTFKNLLSQTLSGASAPTSFLGGTDPRAIGLGMQIDSTQQLQTEGNIANTGVPTDLAIQGDGFFRVTSDITNISTNTEPVVFQRAGNFHFDANGDLVTSDGYHVIGYAESTATPGTPDLTKDTVLNVDPSTTRSVSIGSDGKITRIDNTGTLQTVGWISMTKFANPDGLTDIGSNKWEQSADSGAPVTDPAVAGSTGDVANSPDTGMGGLTPGALEGSNVDLAGEFTTMITAERSFQANARIISTSDTILQSLVTLGQGG